MPAWFIPAIVFVARTAAPHVARALVGFGARRVGTMTAAQVAMRSATGSVIAGGTNLGLQATQHGTDWSSYDVRAALQDAALTAASVGGGAVIFSSVGGSGLRRFAIEFGGTLGIQAGLGAGRVIVNDTDPTRTLFAAMVQTPMVYLRRRFIIGRLIPGGMNSTKGVLVDQGFSLAQEVALRTSLGLVPGSANVSNQHAPSAAPAAAPAITQCTRIDPQGTGYNPLFDFQANYSRCLTCGNY